MTNRSSPGPQPDWSGCGTIGQVEQRRGLQRVLLGEIRTDQALPGDAHLDLAAKPIGDQPEVVFQGAFRVPVPTGESGHGTGERSIHFVFRSSPGRDR